MDMSMKIKDKGIFIYCYLYLFYDSQEEDNTLYITDSKALKYGAGPKRIDICKDILKDATEVTI